MAIAIPSMCAQLTLRSGLAAIVLGVAQLAVIAQDSHAQTVALENSATRIEAVEVNIVNPSADAAVNARVVDLIRRELRAFPDGTFSRAATEVALARVRRMSPITETALR